MNWPGASPEDVDRELVARLESELSGLNGVEEIVLSRCGRASVTLTYGVNQDMDKALVLLLSKLSSVSGLPMDARTPQVRTSNSDDSPIARLALVSNDGADVDLEGLGNFLQSQSLETALAASTAWQKSRLTVVETRKCGSSSTPLSLRNIESH